MSADTRRAEHRFVIAVSLAAAALLGLAAWHTVHASATARDAHALNALQAIYQPLQHDGGTRVRIQDHAQDVEVVVRLGHRQAALAESDPLALAEAWCPARLVDSTDWAVLRKPIRVRVKAPSGAALAQADCPKLATR